MAGAPEYSLEQLTKAKRQTYEGFTKFTLWGTVTVIAIVALMGLFLVA